MKNKIFLIGVLFFLINSTGFAQQWTEPNLIHNNIVSEMDFTIDSSGIFHCVWTELVGTNNSWLYYSSSNDEGISWSEPINISGETDMYLASPSIATNRNANVFVSYTYNIVNPNKTQILVTRYNGNSWENADTVSKHTYGGEWSHLAVNNEGTVYCFWYQWVSPTKGVIHLSKYIDGSWGEIEYPYGIDVMMKINDIVVDHSGKFHFAAAREFLNGKYTEMRLAYFTMENDVWSDVEIVNKRHLCLGNAIAVDSEDKPAMIWVELVNGSELWSYWANREIDGWVEPEFLNKDRYSQEAIYDQVDALHMFDCQWGKNVDESGVYHYYFENGTIHEECIYKKNIPGVRGLKTALHSNKLNVAFITQDSSSANHVYGKLLIMHTDITTVLEEQIDERLSVTAYPNPFKDYCYIQIPSITVKNAMIFIYDGNGRTIRQIKLPKSGRSIKWDGRNAQGQFVPKGIYYILLYSEKSGLRSHIYKTIKM